MSSYNQFVKMNYSKVNHLSNDMRLKKLGEMWKQSKMIDGGGLFDVF